MCVCVCMHVRVHVCVFACAGARARMRVHVHVCVYISKHVVCDHACNTVQRESVQFYNVFCIVFQVDLTEKCSMCVLRMWYSMCVGGQVRQYIQTSHALTFWS